MTDIFSGLEEFGLENLSDVEVYDKVEKSSKSNKNKKPEFQEKDIIYGRTYDCPVCNKQFKAKTVKAGKAKLISSDMDLRPRYNLVDPLKYDAVVCPNCGYASLKRYFNKITDSQIALILKHISATFRGLKDDGEVLSYDDAITRHKLALVNAIVKKSKTSERAYICLKTGWLLRGKHENLDKDTNDYNQTVETLKKEEMEFILKAYVGFTEAFINEAFPMCGMDQNTITLLMAELARKTANYDDAYRFLSRVIIARDANERIKDRAREIKDLIKDRNK